MSRTYNLFNSVVAPAVMGNTVWALVQILVSRSWESSTVPRTTSLVLLSLFFIGDWIDDRPHPTRQYLQGGTGSWLVYFIATTLFYVICASLAIQIAQPFWHWLPLSALSLFVLTAVGQAASVWAEKAEQRHDKTRRWYSVGTNAMSAIAMVALWRLLEPTPVSRGGAVQPEWFHWVITGTLFVAILPYAYSLVRQLRQ